MKKIAVSVFVLLYGLVLFSCGGSSNGSKELERMLFSDYVTEVEYLFESSNGSVAGTARITRNENVRLDILSPDPYTGISVEGDAADNASVISISYSGIRAEIPKDSLGKLSLVLSMFSDTAASAVTNAGKENFMPCEESYTLEGLSEIAPYEVIFTAGDIEFDYIYDVTTGTPLIMCAKTQGDFVQIKIKKLKTNLD